jgi:hypothetical protein
MRHHDQGFTLLQVIAVLVFIDLALVCVASVNSGCRGPGPLKVTRMDMRGLVQAVELAMREDPACPTVEQLVARRFLPKLPRDGWGTPLVLHCPSWYDGDGYIEVTSWGPDRKPGTIDDITSWE